jgi:Uma2 family endonuclease
MSAEVRPRMSYLEYLVLDAASPVKHEYLRGDVWAMAGGTPTHSVIAANVARHLGNALAGRPCAVFNSDLRVRVTATDRSTYPDVTVVCGKREVAVDDPHAITNPIVVVEVLSESTEASDRGETFAHLQRLSALKEYVRVSQDSRRVEVFTRTSSDTWQSAAWGDGAQLRLESLGVSLDVASLYADPTG